MHYVSVNLVHKVIIIIIIIISLNSSNTLDTYTTWFERRHGAWLIVVVVVVVVSFSGWHSIPPMYVTVISNIAMVPVEQQQKGVALVSTRKIQSGRQTYALPLGDSWFWHFRWRGLNLLPISGGFNVPSFLNTAKKPKIQLANEQQLDQGLVDCIALLTHAHEW